MADLNGMYSEDDKPQQFDPIPPGEYVAMIVSSEAKDTKKGDGKYLKLQWKILDGEYENRVIFQQITLTNPNPEAVKIGRGQLAAIRQATGVLKPEDSSEFHDRPVQIKVKIKPGKGEYGPSNEISAVNPTGTEGEPLVPVGAGATSAPPAKAAAPAPAPAGNRNPPWKRK